MKFARKVRRRPFINIIPLIDILVVLLIFYIATTVFKKSEPKINIVVPPSTHGSVTKDPTTPSIIYVTADSKMYLDDVVIQPETLADILKSNMAKNSEYKVALKADKGAPFGMIVQVMDAAKTAGITNLSTFTSPEPGAGGAAP